MKSTGFTYSRVLVLAALPIFAGCKGFSPQAASEGSSPLPSVNAVGNGGDSGSGNGGNTPPALTGVTVANQRMCYRQSRYDGTGGVSFRTIYNANPNGTVQSNFSSISWTVFAYRPNMVDLAGRPVSLSQQMNSESVKVTGVFNSAMDEFGVRRFAYAEAPVFSLGVEPSQLNPVRSRAQAVGGVMTLAVVGNNGQLLGTSEINDAPPSGGNGFMAATSNGSSTMFQIVTPMMSPQANCTGDAPPSACEAECDSNESPLVLDMQGNGIALTSKENGVRFDIDGNGSPNQTAWVASPDDMLLARDLNRNGKIDDGKELFGQATVLRNGRRATNGFVALRDLDSNRDGRIDARDRMFADLLIWSDFNKNGISEANEIRRASTRVQSISLDFQTMREEDEHGNLIMAASTFLNVRGESRSIIDVFFKTDQE